MRQIGTDNLQPGMVTARHVYPPGQATGIPLLAAGVQVTEAIIRRLRRAGVGVLLIDDDLSAGIEAHPPITDDTRLQAVGVLRDSYRSFAADATRMDPDQLAAVEATISVVLAEISARRNLLVCLSDLRLFGGSRLQHALNVCIVGLGVARVFYASHGWRDFKGQRREDGIPDRLAKLGIGLLLQDVGMLGVPEHIREKRGILSSDERGIMRQHPLLALELLEGSELSPLSKVAIAQHHERHDGTGYPRALAGDDLHDNGQIAAIAETYTSLCAEVVVLPPGPDTDTGPPLPAGDAPALEPHEAFRIVLQSRGRMFRPDVVDAFTQAVAPFGPGTTVTLTDGRCGVVAGNVHGHPLAPVVRLTHDGDGLRFSPPVTIDLHRQTRVSIAHVTTALPGDTPARIS